MIDSSDSGDHADTRTSDRIRVLWVIKTLGRGGAEKILCDLARHLDFSRVEIDCAYSDPRWDDFVEDLANSGVRVVPLFRKARGFGWSTRLATLIRRGDYDIVHSHSPLLAAVSRMAVLSLPKGNRPKHISTEHGLRNSYHPITRALNRLTGTVDELCIAVSEGVRSSIHGPLVSRTFVRYQGIDLAACEVAAKQRLVRKIRSDQTLLLTVGSPRWEKDFPTLFDACHEIELVCLDFHLDIAGETRGSEASEIQLLPKKLGIAHRVTFLGLRDDVPALMCSHDILVISSRQEGFPIVALEAAAVGIPIVATRVIDELFTDGVDCLLVDVGDGKSLAEAICRLARDRSLAESLSANAKSLVSTLGIDQTAAQLLSIYSEFARKHAN